MEVQWKALQLVDLIVDEIQQQLSEIGTWGKQKARWVYLEDGPPRIKWFVYSEVWLSMVFNHLLNGMILLGTYSIQWSIILYLPKLWKQEL